MIIEASSQRKEGIEYGSTRRVVSDRDEIRNEMDRRVISTANRVCSDPKLLEDYHTLLDESTLTGQAESEHIDFESMCQDLEIAPRASSYQPTFGRYSERMRALEQVRAPPAREQPRESALSSALRALEREVCGQRE